MTPISSQGAIRDLDLMLGTTITNSGGPCARDLKPYSGDYVAPFPGASEPGFVVERYAFGVNGEMKVLRGDESLPLSFLVERGYNFQI